MYCDIEQQIGGRLGGGRRPKGGVTKGHEETE